MSYTTFSGLDYKNGNNVPLATDTLKIITPSTSSYKPSWFTGTVIRDPNLTTSMTISQVHQFIVINYANHDFPIWIFYNQSSNPGTSYTIFLKKKFGANGILVPPYTDPNLVYKNDIFEGGYLNLYYNELFQPIPISNTCFPAGTLITTNQGPIAIDKIDPNTHTIRNKKIVAITKTVSYNDYLVCFDKDAIAPNIPSEKTIITRSHLIYNYGKMIRAEDFITLYINVYKISYNGEVLYNVLLETYDKMIVNNLICETLHPDNDIAKINRHIVNLNLIDSNNFIKEYNKIYINKNIDLIEPGKLKMNYCLS